MTYKITDTYGETFTTDYLYEETFERLFPDMSDETSAAIDGLIDAMNRDEYTGGYEMFLGISIDKIDYDPMEGMQFEPDDEISISGDDYDIRAYEAADGGWILFGYYHDTDIDSVLAGVNLATFADVDAEVLDVITNC